ncbi:hypothetical protein Glove_100g26 [Diversispora epigaea]|uniref:Tyrosine specific protein phosphatases domain-containing protein n=1 Tax=Diversispora epigaea TaxID=1348612 RepID=A0A397JEC8_9GLOM|nr:hypothetical protein Glove_100g26 [Diversispora epigaea]
MNSILNFRDVGETVKELNIKKIGKIKKGVLFRSGELEDENEQALEKIEKLDIRTIIDLRSGSYEIHKDSSIAIKYPYVNYPSDDVYDDSSDESDENNDDLNKEKRQTINISFAGTKLHRKLISDAPFLSQVQIIFYFLSCRKHKAAKLIGQSMAPKGLVGMYQNLLEACDDQIIKIFEIMTDKSNLPILIHCKHGKDRTGVVIALLLSLCGVDDELIVQDYSMSQKNLISVHSSIIKDMERLGLPESFANVLPDAMRSLLFYIKSTHGSTQNYLIKIGFNLEKQKLLLQNLIEKD